jgi:hypothetical protein
MAELGFDMSHFADAAHLASWAGLCPGNCESAGKRKTGRTRKGNVYLRRALCQAAWAASHCTDCFLTALFYRIAARGGVKKANIAVAHRILVIAYYLLAENTEYREPGGDYFDRRQPAALPAASSDVWNGSVTASHFLLEHITHRPYQTSAALSLTH